MPTENLTKQNAIVKPYVNESLTKEVQTSDPYNPNNNTQPVETFQQFLATQSVVLQRMEEKVLEFQKEEERLALTEKKRLKEKRLALQTELLSTYGEYLQSLHDFDQAVLEEEQELRVLERQYFKMAVALKFGPGAPIEPWSIVPETFANRVESPVANVSEEGIYTLIPALLQRASLNLSQMQGVVKVLLQDLKTQNPDAYSRLVAVAENSDANNFFANLRQEFDTYDRATMPTVLQQLQQICAQSDPSAFIENKETATESQAFLNQGQQQAEVYNMFAMLMQLTARTASRDQEEEILYTKASVRPVPGIQGGQS